MKTNPITYDFEELKTRYEIAADPNAKRYELLPILDLSRLTVIETYNLPEESIISTADNVYSRFWQTINATDWVKHGHDRFSEKSGNKCPYCHESLPRKFEEQFATCFDKKYSDDCIKLVNYQREYAEYINDFIETLRRYVTDILQEFDSNLQSQASSRHRQYQH